MTRNFLCLLLLLAVATFPLSCSNHRPADIHYGEDQCSYCMMNIVNNAFGTELVSSKGKVFKFDSIECLSAFMQSKNNEEIGAHSLWITDFDNPGTFVALDKAFFVLSETQNSPMGLGLVGFRDPDHAKTFAGKTRGRIVSWDDVCTLVQRKWRL